ncbi:(2Fe-2S) ferredoxin domain-containing protein [Streptomyces somaliensis]|uniref:(2Fe-2S) ferredoxin domain-containing protein n=1 Tax=Streptomyces somaliensis TaxID=78355 RepID=UPI0020CF0C27|nr:(2Fe-2S) ferredoxin domain-containing protein [Streptomyces somaliensis]MCP9943626.1 (2Fe-2S) ferredoxin domain-containing protein [Streptomyces somaliensis]MCP9963128.1 (2Fe-2S) ferredoxin domain-containing protein [Streptomyces somaliensis]MCP9975976.1 (2Fe-2S) ferredoxin domain-containing protein [Streptomyces somaliensis]
MTRGWIRPGAARPCSLVVCRGCCCGDARKNPGTDHAGQLERLRRAAAASDGRLAVRTSDCLGPCGQANVVVVQPSTEARRRGARAAWIGWVLDDDCLDELLAWVEAGGPGAAEPPAALVLQMIDPPSDARRRTR